jgi:hypothetical protein
VQRAISSGEKIFDMPKKELQAGTPLDPSV